MKNLYYINLFFYVLSLITIPNYGFSKSKIYEIKNDIYLLDIYGKRSFLTKNNQIKLGDYLSTRGKPATLILNDNTKICFSSNSSIKISKNKIFKDNNQINIDFKKGNILFYINENSIYNYNISFFSYNLKNIRDKIILLKKNNLKIINFKNNINIFFNDYKNKINLPSFTILELSNNGKVSKTTKILETNKFSKDFLEDCEIKLPKTNKIENKNFKLQYGCISQNGKLVCGNKYK